MRTGWITMGTLLLISTSLEAYSFFSPHYLSLAHIPHYERNYDPHVTASWHAAGGFLFATGIATYLVYRWTERRLRQKHAEHTSGLTRLIAFLKSSLDLSRKQLTKEQQRVTSLTDINKELRLQIGHLTKQLGPRQKQKLDPEPEGSFSGHPEQHRFFFR